jgi:hypothetical protein
MLSKNKSKILVLSISKIIPKIKGLNSGKNNSTTSKHELELGLLSTKQ